MESEPPRRRWLLGAGRPSMARVVELAGRTCADGEMLSGGGRGRGHLTSLGTEEPLLSVHTLGWPPPRPGHGLSSAHSPPSAQGHGHSFPISVEGTWARG